MARTRESGNKKHMEPRAGVFDRAVDRRAFFDKVVLTSGGKGGLAQRHTQGHQSPHWWAESKLRPISSRCTRSLGQSL